MGKNALARFLRDGGKALHRKHQIDEDHKNGGGANSREQGQRDTGTPSRGAALRTRG